MIKKHSIGHNTVTSIDGIISTRGVKSKPNDIRIFGYTHEIGKGEKSPNNPYKLVDLDSGNVNLYNVNDITNIQITNDGHSRKGIILESSIFKSGYCSIFFTNNNSLNITQNNSINIKSIFKDGTYEDYNIRCTLYVNRVVKIEKNIAKIIIYSSGSSASDNYFDLYENLTILDSPILPTETITEEHSITLTNNNTTIQVPILVQLRSVEDVSDYIFKDTDGIWKLMQNCQKYEFSGNENFSVYQNVFFTDNTITDYQANNCVVCNSNFYTAIKNQVSAFDMTSQINNSICFRIKPYNNTIYIKSTSFTTKNSFMSWLLKQYEVGTPLIMIYQLKIPIVHTLSNYAQELLNSFVLENKNNISVEGNPNIEISGYLKKRSDLICIFQQVRLLRL